VNDGRTTYFLGTDPISEREYLQLQGRYPSYAGDSKVEATFHGKKRPLPTYAPPVVIPVPRQGRHVETSQEEADQYAAALAQSWALARSKRRSAFVREAVLIVASALAAIAVAWVTIVALASFAR
jgi:hypothetical protein